MSKPQLTTFDAHTSKRISFILPTKNRAGFLENALEKCRSLVGPEDELLIIDGASTDTTHEVVHRYADIVDVFVSESEANNNHAMNKGVLLARGKYIKLITDDDIFYREGMEQAVHVMEEHPEIDVLLCGGIKEKDKREFVYSVPRGVHYGKSPEDVFRYKGTSGVGHFVRRSSLARLGLMYPATPKADVDFVLQCMQKGGVVRFSRIKSFYHPIYTHSASVAYRQRHLDENYRLAKQYCSRWFYIRYRLKMEIRNYPVLHGMLAWFKNIVSKPQPISSFSASEENRWDTSLC